MDVIDITVDGETVIIEQGDTFTVNTALDFGLNQVVFEPGETITVDRIVDTPGGISFELTSDTEEETYPIDQFALELDLENNHLSYE